jgi:hypothetical protein
MKIKLGAASNAVGHTWFEGDYPEYSVRDGFVELDTLADLYALREVSGYDLIVTEDGIMIYDSCIE